MIKLSADFVGVDFVLHKGIWRVNGIEDVVDTRMIYELSDKDPAKDYMAYIMSRL